MLINEIILNSTVNSFSFVLSTLFQPPEFLLWNSIVCRIFWKNDKSERIYLSVYINFNFVQLTFSRTIKKLRKFLELEKDEIVNED